MIDKGTDHGTAGVGDSFNGGNGNDRMVARVGQAHMLDGHGNDVLYSGRGRDFLLLSNGADRVRAGFGNDTVQVDFDADVDVIQCGPGEDHVQFMRRDPKDRYFRCEHFSVIPPLGDEG